IFIIILFFTEWSRRPKGQMNVVFFHRLEYINCVRIAFRLVFRRLVFRRLEYINCFRLEYINCFRLAFRLELAFRLDVNRFASV
ncbi:hypothetical protein L9F63_018424, partial [Diploptera punctata]